MAVTGTLQVQINAKDDVRGGIGPRSFSLPLAGVIAQELGVKVLQADADHALAIQPPPTGQVAVVIASDQNVTFKKNSEGIVHSIGAGGVYVAGPLPALTQLLFSGNGVNTANVYVFVVSN